MRKCYVMERSQPVARSVETGQFNDEFIEIHSGLKEGELVLLHPPVRPESLEDLPPETPEGKEEKKQPVQMETKPGSPETVSG
jgi:hypothetical protein